MYPGRDTTQVYLPSGYIYPPDILNLPPPGYLPPTSLAGGNSRKLLDSIIDTDGFDGFAITTTQHKFSNRQDVLPIFSLFLEIYEIRRRNRVVLPFC